MRIALATLGCKVNRADTDALRVALAELGEEVPFEAEADLYIVSSCTVTAVADRQTRQLVYRARRRSPAARIALTGCYPRVDRAGALAISGVDRAFTLAEHAELVAWARSLAITSGSSAAAGPEARRRPFLKVQDGCDGACSYCIVPRARGRSTSVEPSRVLSELAARAAAGFEEVVLAGIHLGAYGRDLAPRVDLVALLELALERVPRVRIRLSSIEPDEVGDDLLSLISAPAASVCPHLHLPVQSGDDGILAAMNRPYRAALLAELAARLRACAPAHELAVGADLIAGFPGETEEQHRRSLELALHGPFTHLHVFPFSPRPGTPAASLPGRLDPLLARERAARLRAAGRRRLAAFAAAQVGHERCVLVERVDRARSTCSGVTENYLRAVVTLGPQPAELGIEPARLLRVVVEGADGTALRCRATAPSGS
jgi:threonylcarbamoyladenosine tRNA methylthiotransferase MtaB